MRLAFLAPEFIPTVGGVGIYSVNLIRELSRDSSLDIHVITPKRGDYNEKMIESEFNNRIKVHQISRAKDTFLYNFVFQFAVLRKFNGLNNQYHFDLVHSANLVHMPDIFLKFWKQNIPNVVTAHTTITGQVKGFLKSNKNFFKMASSEKGSVLAYPIIFFLEQLYLKRTRNLITVSNKFAGRFFSHNVYVTQNGIVADVFNYEKIKDPFETYPQLKDIKKPIILFAGRLITQKGIEVLVKVMKELQDKVHFVIAGSGNAAPLNRLLRKYSIEGKNYTFLGFIQNSRLPPLYKLSAIHVLPSFYENFPISLLEAMAMKCCCVAANSGAVDEIIDHKINGIIVEPGDIVSLVDNINYLLEHRYERLRLAENGYRKVMANFTSIEMAKRTKMIYNEILK
jgi:glycogen(starch) synthase